MDDEVTVTGVLEVDKDGTWHYLHVPAEVRARWTDRARRGSIRVVAACGGTEWEGSLLPWAEGSAQLSLGPKVRKAEGLQAGDAVMVRLRAAELNSRCAKL